MSGTRDSSHRSLSESQFRWRAAPPNDPTRPHEQGSRGKVKNGSKQEPNQVKEEGPAALGLNLPSSVMVTYDAKGFALEGHREQSKERRRSDPSDKEAHSTFILYDHSGRIIPQRKGSTYSEQPGHQKEDIQALEYRRWNPDHVTSRDRRSTPPPKPTSAVGPTESGLVKTTSHPHPQVLTRPSALMYPPLHLGPTSPDLQQGPSSTTSHIHPAVLQNSATALGPIRALYEQAWYQTVSNVQNEMTRMHRELVDAVDRERAARSHLAEECKALQQDLESAKLDLRNARRDSDRLMAENERLRQAAKDQIGHRDDREHQVREAAKSYIDQQLDQLKSQYGEQMEKQRVEAERALEQQKVMFERERRELHKIAVAHERSMQRSGSESASTLVASDTEKVVSPFCDQGLHKNGVQQESIRYDRPRGRRMSVSSGTKSPASSRPSPQAFSGLLSRCQGPYRALSPLTPSIPPKEVFTAASPEDGHLGRDFVQKDGSMDLDMDVDTERAVDNLAPAPDPVLSTSAHCLPVSSQSPGHPTCHTSSSRSPSIPLASIMSKPLTNSPSPIGNREQPVRSAWSSPSVTIPKARSRRSSLSNQNVHYTTPPMGSLGMRPYSQPSSRCASRAVSPNRINSVGRPALRIDVSPVAPPIAVLEELNVLSRQQQEPPLSAKLLKTESPSLSLSSPAQMKPQPTHHRISKSATPQPQQQQSGLAPLPAPPPPSTQQIPLKLQLHQPAQPLKQPTPQLTRSTPPPPPLPPTPLQLPQSSHNGLHKLPQQSQSHHAYQSYGQTGCRTWVSYPYTSHYQHSPVLPLPVSTSASAAVQSTQSASGSFSTQKKRDRVEYEGDSGAGKRVRTKVKVEDGSGDGPMTTTVEAKEAKRVNKIGITHMDLLYETQGTKMTCRMCRMSSKDEQKINSAVTFPVDAKWTELIGHCQSVHPKLCADLEKLSPSQVQELRQRMQSGKLTGYTLKS